MISLGVSISGLNIDGSEVDGIPGRFYISIGAGSNIGISI